MSTFKFRMDPGSKAHVFCCSCYNPHLKKVFVTMKAILMMVACVLLTNDAQSKSLSSFEIVHHMLESEEIWHQKQIDANGVEDETCCEPDTLQGTMHLYRNTQDSITEVKFYHDQRNCRLATLSSSHSPNSNQLRTVVSCQSANAKCIIYTMDERRAKCKRQVMLNATLDDFWKRCLPRNSNNTGMLRIGADIVGQSSLPLQLWQFLSDFGKHRKLTTTLGCLPVAEVVSTSSWNKSGRLTIYFFDLDTKIRDLNVFEIPSYCHLAVERKSVYNAEEKKQPFIFRFK